MRIAIGTDHRGFAIRARVIELVEQLGHEVEDVGTFSGEPVDYPDIAAEVAEKVGRGTADRGILVCGTGLGMCIAANKVPGAYAALCADAYSADRARKSNNANIMTLGAQVIGSELAKTLVTIWMGSEYTPGGRSAAKVQRICDYEKERLAKGK